MTSRRWFASTANGELVEITVKHPVDCTCRSCGPVSPKAKLGRRGRGKTKPTRSMLGPLALVLAFALLAVTGVMEVS